MNGRIPAFDRRSLISLAGFLALCFAVAAIGGMVTAPEIAGWYDGLVKPSFTPPNRLFGPVWSLLYAMMAIAAWLVWRHVEAGAARRRAIAVFILQLAVNLAWSFAFFGAESPGLGLAVILLLDGLIVWTIARFAAIDRPAAWLLVPYLLWVGYATALNAGIVVLN